MDRFLEFEGFKVKISDKVYKPSEDTFLLIKNLNVDDGDVVLEIGCGCGIVSLVAAKKASKVVAVDINPYAVQLTLENARLNGLEGKVEARLGNLFKPVKQNEKFNLIIFNPPYLPVKKNEKIGGWLEKAWDGGFNGRRVIDRFITGVEKFLERNGRIVMVQSSLSNVKKTFKMFTKKGFTVKILGREKFDFEEIFCFEAAKPSI
ncbi:MAG: class I SAM-dependent methyltransferase [Candidatus Bathyarchaeota archaeon]|nr:class I SAM-dependent methyltransferase [Candidatus Bathyarchaeota archaeon]